MNLWIQIFLHKIFEFFSKTFLNYLVDVLNSKIFKFFNTNFFTHIFLRKSFQLFKHEIFLTPNFLNFLAQNFIRILEHGNRSTMGTNKIGSYHNLTQKVLNEALSNFIRRHGPSICSRFVMLQRSYKNFKWNLYYINL